MGEDDKTSGRWVEIARAATPEGDDLVLRRRAEEFEIRFNGWELMSSRTSRSEEALARLVYEDLRRQPQHVLIGGLGMAYTLRAALDLSGPQTRIVVSELVPEVVEWVRGPLAGLARRTLDDRRVQVTVGGVARVLGDSRRRFDAILLDTDNGPRSVLRAPNRFLYRREGVELALGALTPGGSLGFWAADRSEDFELTLDIAGASWRRAAVPARAAGDGPDHSIYLVRSR